MTLEIESDPAAEPPRAATIARISRSALAGNIRLAREAGAETWSRTALRADAWGHGADLVERMLCEAGLVENAAAGEAKDIDPLSLYGLPGAVAGATPAMRLSGVVLSTKELLKGEGVSYGYLHRAQRDTRVALITGGYAQGVVRSLGGAISVALGGRRVAVIGRVAMDVCVVDIEDADATRGDEAVFFGDPARGEPSLDPWVAASGLHAGEIVAAVGLHAAREEAR